MSPPRYARARVPPLGPQVPRSRSRLLAAIGRTALAARGWNILGELPDLPKFVVIFAPHTSNWDFAVGLAAKWALGIEAHWIGKHTLFRWPLGPVMRRLGGIAVDRREPQGLVGRVVSLFGKRDRLVVGLAPEGTRNRGDWRTGFYHIAREAGVPIVPVALDFGGRAFRIGPARPATGDYPTDLAYFQAFCGAADGARR